MPHHAKSLWTTWPMKSGDWCVAESLRLATSAATAQRA
jgi:hypothetical protein